MRLETASVGVRDLRFSDRTRFEDGVLSIQKEELRQLLLEDDTFEDVGLEVVRPGESVRIIHVMDAVEPRYKPEPWSTFPRFVGPPKTVGEGRTHRLAGMSSVSVGGPPRQESPCWRGGPSALCGPGAAPSPFGAWLNPVAVPSSL